MYVSRAAATIRDDPVPDADVELVVETADDADVDAVADALEAAGATIDRRLQFDDLAVTVAQADVGAVCDVDGIAAVQTADAIGIHPDEAGEDVDPDADGLDPSDGD